ncbi:hypothetical protein ACOI9R_35515, partial [Mesorhizobium japonicum]
DLAGPVDIDGSRAGDAVERVMAHPLCRYLGLLALPERAEAFGRCMGGLIPYRDNPYTAGVFAMKVHEYLAAGLEVVATPIPSLAEVRLDGMHLASPEQFADRVVRSLDGFDEGSARRRSEVVDAADRAGRGAARRAGDGAMSTATRLLGQLFRDPGENRGMLWMLIVNGILAGHAVPARVRTVGYRLAGLRLHTTALLRPGTVVRDRALTIGAHSTVNYGCVFDNRESVRIGDRVGVGIGVRFITSEHETTDPRRRAGDARLEPIVVADEHAIA